LAVGNLGIAAPIIWDVPLIKELYTAKLLDGVIHIAGTAKPGQQGMVVISGHSSNYPWIQGSYNSVFAPLLKAQVDQTIEINYQNKQYIYKITKSYEVKPDDLTPLSDGSGNGIRLITCTPLGTSLRRLVVEGVQISPDPSTNTAFTTSSFTGTIPDAR
jgi:LPXTG-site transpeptidase (sortase) family protein